MSQSFDPVWLPPSGMGEAYLHSHLVRVSSATLSSRRSESSTSGAHPAAIRSGVPQSLKCIPANKLLLEPERGEMPARHAPPAGVTAACVHGEADVVLVGEGGRQAVIPEGASLRPLHEGPKSETSGVCPIDHVSNERHARQ